jgi:hypothetical protein
MVRNEVGRRQNGNVANEKKKKGKQEEDNGLVLFVGDRESKKETEKQNRDEHREEKRCFDLNGSENHKLTAQNKQKINVNK